MPNTGLHIAERDIAPLVLVGGGGHALVVTESGTASGWSVVGFLDDEADAALGRSPNQILRVGKIAELTRIGDRCWILGVGSLEFRGVLIERLAQMELGRGVRTVVHPTASVSPTARLGNGVFIGPGAIVNARAMIMDHAIVNTGAIVEHECTVGFNSHIAPGAILAGRVRIGSHTLIGIGARVLPNLSVGDRSVVGAGSVVIRSVVDGQTVVGVPARAR
jgi:sugar O-acyltransferase (sialic acid O-acetyltransferase NeuD family)